MAKKELAQVHSRTTANAAGTEIGAAQAGLAHFDWVTVYATLTGLTGGALDVYIQTEIADNVWADWAHFPQVAAAGAVRTYALVPETAAVINTTGRGTTAVPGVALAANTCIGGHPGDKIRVIYVSGAGTAVGAAQRIEVVGVNLK